MGWFSNAPLKRKQIYLAIATGVSSTLAMLIVGAVMGTPGPTAAPTPATANKSATVNKSATKAPTAKKTETKAKTSGSQAAKTAEGPPFFLIALASGLLTGAGAWLLSQLLIRQIKGTIDDLQNQFDAIYEGNFNVRAKVLSEDELGQLAQRFNYISQVILTATTEAQERATATEKAREKLQRQVIRLLDDVEGASRGDLTVQAEVTADELGAVADAFNLTIQNLCEIVQQVKRAAKQVNKNSTDSEAFARNNSSDALRMAEELAVTLNSVQLMTESIQRVAENAHEAEEVAHTSSVTALKGGEAVERTVGGILQIRETVSETARKVKRLAEASQEISKIVAVISQIASRTNLLALNASIQAARAGEAGRGFAIVADEVRQLADRSAKSLKEIEQIVLQIQSETGSVMTAMEEGIQQVIDVTDKSEQSKRALEDIIEVSNRINTLVRSISGDTVKQQENSGAVAQVMQSIELIAQETSQESQRVAGSLQTLVSISRDLLTSVERFRVDKNGK
jgi:twitching motility protein PilJ